MRQLTQDRLKEVLTYNPETGVFRWKAKPAGNVAVGSVAGTTNNKGYRYISVDSRRYRAHRLAWLYVHGKWPADQIDHIDGKRGNNRIANLREATNTQNQQNRGVSKSNTSGFKGVVWNKQTRKWQATIRIWGRQIFLGSFDTIERAAAAYSAAAARHHGEFDGLARIPSASSA